MGKTLVLGASPIESRFSCKAVKALVRREYEVVAVGKTAGNIRGVEIRTGMPHLEDVDTILLYLGPGTQEEYYDYMIGLKPRRIIFNPGTHNPEFIKMCKKHGIDPVVDCALIMLNSDTY